VLRPTAQQNNGFIAHKTLRLVSLQSLQKVKKPKELDYLLGEKWRYVRVEPKKRHRDFGDYTISFHKAGVRIDLRNTITNLAPAVSRR
jgi:hypothetical protein